jgi:transposase
MRGLALQVQEGLVRDPFAGDIYLFRGRSGSLIKALWHDGLGLSLYAKQLQQGSFRWPPIMDGVMKLSALEFAALFDGLDRTRVQTTKAIHKPTVAG